MKNIRLLFLIILLQSVITVSAQLKECNISQVTVDIIYAENANIIQGNSTVPGSIGPLETGDGSLLEIESTACGAVSFEVQVDYLWDQGEHVNWIHGVSFKASSGWSSAQGIVPPNWIWADQITGDCSNNTYDQGGYYYDGTDQTSLCDGVSIILPNDGDASNNWGINCGILAGDDLGECPLFNFKLDYCPLTIGNTDEWISFIFTDDGETGNWDQPANCVFRINIPVKIDQAGVQFPNDTTICDGNSLILDAGSGCEDYIWSTGETTSSIEVTPTEPTTYSVTVGDGDCNIVGEINVDISEGLEAGDDNFLTVCEGYDEIINLGDYLSYDADLNGEWFDEYGDYIPDPQYIDISTASPGIYEYIYRVDNDTCEADEAIITIEIDERIYAGDDYSFTICQNQVVNLFDSLTNCDNYDGIWFDGSKNIVYNPENVFCDSVCEYHFLYILSESEFCPNDSAEAIITTIAPPYVGSGDTLKVCHNSVDTVNLFDYLSDYSSTTGVWYDENNMVINTAKEYATKNLTIDTFTYSYILSDSTGHCPSDTGRVSLIVVPQPFAGNDNSITVCNSEVNNVVNLDLLLGVHDESGIWIDMNNTQLNPDNVKHLDFTGVPIGTYIFKYILDKNTLCPPDSAIVEVTVIEKTLAGTDKNLVFCSETAVIINLNQELKPDDINNIKYEDYDHSSALDLAKGEIDISKLPVGNFKFGIITGIGELCGTDTSILTIEIVDFLSAGNDNSIELCTNDDNINLDTLLGQHDMGGKWIDLNNSGIDITGDNIKNMDFSGIPQGIYKFEYKIDSTEFCPGSMAFVTVYVNPITYFDFNRSICPNDSFIIGDNVYDENNLSGVEILKNIYGCDSVVTINLELKNISANIDVIDANCFGVGKLIIEQIEGGSLPATIILNQEKDMQITDLPFEIENLKPGDYSYTIIDSEGCELKGNYSFNIKDFEPYSIDIDVTTLEYSYSLYVTTDIEVNTIVWTPPDGLSCTNCLDPIATTGIDRDYVVVITDKEGCEVRDTVHLGGIVKIDTSVYIPNVFTPDGDGFNDMFYPSSNIDDLKYSMYIFNRWGEKLFFADNLTFNDEESGWDGTYKGKRLNTAVFVYMIIIKTNREKDIIKSGDVLLLH